MVSQEPGISYLLQKLYLDNDENLQRDFGPKVKPSPSTERHSIYQLVLSFRSHNRVAAGAFCIHFSV